VIKKEEIAIGSAFPVGGQVIQAVVGFGVNLVLIRYLAPEEFRRFAIILAGAAKDRYFGAALIETIFATSVICIWIMVSSSEGRWEIGLVLALGLRHWMHQNKAFFERTMPYRKHTLTETLVATTSHLVALGLVLSGVGWIVLIIHEIFLTMAGECGLMRPLKMVWHG
jgi:hypothetical protein